ncbi:MAG: metal-dependent phosphohydrolase, partial [Pseudomonadota bacterium]
MLIPAHLVANALAEEVVQTYRETFGDRNPEHLAILHSTSRLVIEWIANSDALYHDSHHTVMVTLVGQSILRGRIL